MFHDGTDDSKVNAITETNRFAVAVTETNRFAVGFFEEMLDVQKILVER